MTRHCKAHGKHTKLPVISSDTWVQLNVSGSKAGTTLRIKNQGFMGEQSTVCLQLGGYIEQLKGSAPRSERPSKNMSSSSESTEGEGLSPHCEPAVELPPGKAPTTECLSPEDARDSSPPSTLAALSCTASLLAACATLAGTPALLILRKWPLPTLAAFSAARLSVSCLLGRLSAVDDDVEGAVGFAGGAGQKECRM